MNEVSKKKPRKRKRKVRYRFRDQPDGNCFECKWNEALKTGPLLCSVPGTHVTNPICMQKMQLALARNIDWELARANWDLDVGDEWKDGDDDAPANES